MNDTAANARDAGLALIGRLNRWMIAGAIGLSGMISLVAARSFHGHTTSSSATVSQPASSSSSSGSSGGGSSSSSSGGGPSSPAQAPSSSPAPSAPAPVISGGS